MHFMAECFSPSVNTTTVLSQCSSYWFIKRPMVCTACLLDSAHSEHLSMSDCKLLARRIARAKCLQGSQGRGNGGGRGEAASPVLNRVGSSPAPLPPVFMTRNVSSYERTSFFAFFTKMILNIMAFGYSPYSHKKFAPHVRASTDGHVFPSQSRYTLSPLSSQILPAPLVETAYNGSVYNRHRL